MLLWKRIAATGLAMGMLAAGAAAADAAGVSPDDGATIRYTEFGIPHIVANDYVTLGFGQGYAAAKDNLCAIADVAVTTRAERSRWLGPEAPPYLHVVAFNGTGCPDTTTLLTYSQSADPTSPHHSDQTELYSRKQWVTERFCEKDIVSSPSLEVVRVSRR